jgi:plastocyanin
MFLRKLSARSATLLIAALLLRIACSAGLHLSVREAAAAESSEPVDNKSKTVLINHFKYQPDTLTVNLGDTVEWKNDDIVPHTVTGVDRKAFDSGRIAKGASWHFTATKRGTYDYLCALHPNMKARLIVQ